MWRKSGISSGTRPETRPGTRMETRPGTRAGRIPDLTVVSGAPLPTAGLEADRNRPLIIRFGKYFRGFFDRLIASSSLVSNEPVLDVRDFAWSAILRKNWRTIRGEAIAVALQGEASPSLATISPDHRAIAPMNMWRSFFLWGYSFPIEDNLAQCPKTATIVEQIPGRRGVHPAAGDHLRAAHIVDPDLAGELCVHVAHPGIGHGHDRVVLRDERDGAQRLGVSGGGEREDGGCGQRSDQLQAAHGDPFVRPLHYISQSLGIAWKHRQVTPLLGARLCHVSLRLPRAR